jgi:peroxiredoxin Q/BCP
MKNPLTQLVTLIGLTFGLIGSAGAEISVGEPAPDFRLQDQNGDWHTLQKHRGHWVALYFYPKDDTPGCTKEACAFRDNIFAFEEIDAIVLGVSLDDTKSHEEFAEKYSLPFSLLADTEGETAKAYGVLTNIAGFRMAKRQSFLIDPEGRIARHYRKVDPQKHSEEVLADLKRLRAEGPPTDG